jgi:flagellar hook-associated protein 3 FlgL
MRVTGNSFTDSLVTQLNLLNARQYRLQNQASTGQRIQAPEDDPAAMGQALQLQAESSNVDQYSQNIATLQTRSTATYSVLAQLKTISDRIGEITTLAGDGTKSADTLKTYGAEVTHLIQESVQLMNTKQNGQYLFGGTASDQAPFVMTQDANGNVTGVTYQGNSTVTQSEIAENTTIAVDVPGANNSGTGPRGIISDDRSGADFFNHLISLQNHLQAGDSAAISTTDQPALTSDENNIIYQVATNGAIQARLEAESSIATSRKSNLTQSISNVAGADLTQTLVQLSKAQTAYQAALQTSSNILQMQQSLLSYLP